MQIEVHIENIVCEYFSKINANLIKNDKLFSVSVPQNFSNIFGTSLLKFYFDPNTSAPSDYELFSPGSNNLLKIINQCLDLGPVAICKLKNACIHSDAIRFYFFVLFESVISRTKMIHVDIILDSKKIIDIKKYDIEKYDIEKYDILNNKELSKDVFDDCYVEAISFLEYTMMKLEISNFQKDCINLRQKEIQSIKEEYRIRSKEIQEKFILLRSKGQSAHEIDRLIDENQNIREDEKAILESIRKKYSTIIDFALIGAVLFLK